MGVRRRSLRVKRQLLSVPLKNRLAALTRTTRTNASKKSLFYARRRRASRLLHRTFRVTDNSRLTQRQLKISRRQLPGFQRGGAPLRKRKIKKPPGISRPTGVWGRSPHVKIKKFLFSERRKPRTDGGRSSPAKQEREYGRTYCSNRRRHGPLHHA